ncbi:hypothetical protein CBS147337_10098 [Penicillium roqueforti]|nr:hypothetical protein CBS147337_10098 [Penicillium roqueforti]
MRNTNPPHHAMPATQVPSKTLQARTNTATTNVSSISSGTMSPQQHHKHHHHMFASYRTSSGSGGSEVRGVGSGYSSPDLYHQRERYDFVSSSSSNNWNDCRRPPRPKYEEEEMYVIWYHRVDLCQEWKEVREIFNRHFPSWQRRGFQGIQCKFYRFIKEKRCPTLREQQRMRDCELLREGAESGAPHFGVIVWTNVCTSKPEEEASPVVNPSQQGTDLISDLGYSIYGRRRRPSRRLLESLGKVYTAGALNTAPARQVDPTTFHEAVSGPNQLEWWATIQKEYASLMDHGTWEKVRRPAGDHVIGCEWVFKTKANGTRKARLVIKGYREKHGIDYHETFAAVSRMDSVRYIVASAVLRGWKLHQFDARASKNQGTCVGCAVHCMG